MVSSASHSKPSPQGADESAPRGNLIPPRQPQHSPRRRMPPHPSARAHTIRLIIATALALAAMFGLFMLAVKYATHDWNLKNQRAKQAGRRPAKSKPKVSKLAPDAWRYEFPAEATERELARLTQDPYIPNHWLLFGRSLSDKTAFPVVQASYWMALAYGVETADVRNDLGAAYLRQGRTKAAYSEFLFAQQIEPGFVPSLFNLALCAIAERDLPKANRFLTQYLVRRPRDLDALRLQASLLSQGGQSPLALLMLEKTLRSETASHPLFLEAALVAAQLGQQGKAIRYLETSMNGNPIQAVIRVFQSPAFRDIRLSDEGNALSSRLASRARIQYGTPVKLDEITPLRSAPAAIVR